MSGYTVFTLVFSDRAAIPSDVDDSWPEPPGEPDSYGEKYGAYRHHRVDGRTVGVQTNLLTQPNSSGFLEQVFDRYEPQYVVVTLCSDTSDTAIGRLYAAFANGPQLVDEGSDDDHDALYGDGLKTAFEAEWGIQPWTIWDLWDGRGTE
ncbi:hypothetical protein [Natronobeatus ordinarius]|uniref:hypothetical protein n=1 Tax=Natronobeatus ordinarius TaxID=2963433 RepID=UPI0020CEBE9F|nr:hypothetical protein [Natronobeatus ordinarius]